MGIRIQLRLGTTIPNDEFLDVGEAIWDPENNRLGMGSGNAQPSWYPGIDPINQDLILDGSSLLRSEIGGARARFGFDAKDRFSLYTISGLRLRITDATTNFYNRVALNAGGTLAGDVDTAGGRFTSMNIQEIIVSSSSQRILIKDDDTGAVVGRIDDNGVTGKSLQNLYLVLAAQMETTNQLFRNMFSSGIVGTRMGSSSRAFNPMTKVSDGGFSAITVHNHPDFQGLAGLAELALLINGYHFQTRHNDYRMSRPVYDQNVFGKRALNTGVPVPSSVTNLPLGYTGLVLNGNLTGTQVEWMRKVYTDHKDYCVFELAYIELWIQKFDESLLDVASSTRHFNSTKNFKKTLEFVNYYIRSGYKMPSENVPMPAGVVATFDANGHPVLGYVNWRISSFPVATLSNNNVNMTIDGVNHNLRALPFNKEAAIAGIVDASNRFKLRRNLRPRYATTAGNILDERDKLSWNEVYESSRAMFDCADLELLCRMVPGFNGTGNDDEQFENDANGAKVKTNRSTRVRYSAFGTDKGLNYYNNKYIVNTKDAVGDSVMPKGFNDANLFTAKANWPQVIGGYTFMIPLELVLRTPRENWNPFLIPYQARVTGDGTATKPYSGYNEFGSFFTLPVDSIVEQGKGKTNADTRYSAYMSTPSGIKTMYASGIRIFDIDGHRRRFPVIPNSIMFSEIGSELMWLKHALKPLLKKIAAGTIIDDEIDDAF